MASAFMGWSQVFGAYPAKIVTDLRPEFINRVVVDFTISKGVTYLVTPGYAPASSGLINRHISPLKDIFYKHVDTMEGGMVAGRRWLGGQTA